MIISAIIGILVVLIIYQMTLMGPQLSTLVHNLIGK